MNNLPTQSGFYWIVEDIGMTYVRLVCWVHVPNEKDKPIEVLSPFNTIPRDAKSPAWNPNVLLPAWKPWDNKFVAWHGPLPVPDQFQPVKTDGKQAWKDIGV